jgi:hypothetical protein
METIMEMEQLVAAFASSVTMSGNDNNNLPVPDPPPAAQPAQMEDLVAAFAASLTMPGNDNHAALKPVPNLSHDNQETTTASTDGAEEDDDGEPAKGEEACVLRVRFPDGRVRCRSFGAGRRTATLYRYCRSVLFAGARGRAFRLVRLAGGASDEVRAGSSKSLRDLGLHRSTVHVVLT